MSDKSVEYFFKVLEGRHISNDGLMSVVEKTVSHLLSPAPQSIALGRRAQVSVVFIGSSFLDPMLAICRPDGTKKNNLNSYMPGDFLSDIND